MVQELQALDRNLPADRAVGNLSSPIAIAVGANLAGPFGSPLAACQQAVRMIAALPFLRPAGVSTWYDTEPVPRSMQPNFVNGVALFVTREAPVDPAKLLKALNEIETQGGRRRFEPNAARTLDLDIVIMGDLIRAAPDPVLPHPRAHLRRFVLEPLRDVLPQWRHPVLGRTVEELLAGLPPDGTRRLADGR